MESAAKNLEVILSASFSLLSYIHEIINTTYAFLEFT